MKIIDIYAHIFPDEIAPTTIKYLKEEANTKAYLNGTISNLKSSMKRAGISISVNQPISTKPSQVQSINNWAKQSQDETIIASHLDGYQMWDNVEEYLVGRDIYFDTFYVIDYMEAERFVTIVKNHGFDKILFATDSPWKDQADEVKKISALNIPQEIKSDVFWGNASRIIFVRSKSCAS